MSKLRVFSFGLLLAVVALVTTLAGCGAGKPLPGPGAVPVNGVTGVAATGSPIFGTIYLKDASSPTVEMHSSTASDGTFQIDTAKLKAPFILKVTDANNNTYYSIATDGSGITNINPLTTVVVSVAAGGADLNAFYNSWYLTSSATAVLNLADADTKVHAALGSVLDQFVASGNLINSTYVADHTGADAMLDVIGVTVSATGTITLTNKSTTAVIFTGNASQASTFGTANGPTVNAANIPGVPVQSRGATLYRTNCLQCHGDLPNSTLIGINTVAKISNAIATNLGGMSAMGGLTAEQIQAINDVIPAQAQAPNPNATPGETLYAQKCAACHKQLASSTKAGATVTRIQDALATVTDMVSLKSLTSTQLTDIASALAAVTPPTPTPGTPPGQTLYVNNCESCHTPFANSDRAGATVARINGAIASNTGRMGSLIRLTQAEISDIAAALATVALPATAATPGETLYRTYCATCHLAFASTTKAGATVSRINTAVTANTGGMGFVNTSLTTTQIADIAATLGTITPPVIMDGATLYASYCAGCHNPPGDTSLQNSTKKGLTLARFNAATTTNSSATGMGYLAASLSVDQVNAIITVMPPLPVDGPGLYTAKCSTCHGVLTSSSKGGATVSRINTGIANNPTQMGTLGLSASDISLIAAALAGVTPPTLDGPGLYTANCSSCHGALSVSAKAGPSMTVARIQAGIAANAGMSGFATSLTVPQLTLISDALFALPAPVLDGSGLYAANCASCHNPLLTSTKGGAKAAKIQQEITNKRGSVAGVGGMGAANLVNLSPAQLTLIEQALSTILPPACGSCHPVTHTTLKTGTHTFHLTNTTKVKGVIRTALADTTTCGICHGTGYTTVSNGSLLTHNNGTTNIAITAGANSTTVFGIKTWNATSKSCTPGCHGAKTW